VGHAAFRKRKFFVFFYFVSRGCGENGSAKTEMVWRRGLGTFQISECPLEKGKNKGGLLAVKVLFS
jgi:hypothetical protein